MRVTEVACRTIVNPTGGFLRGYTHTINPYHGCSFGRSLCGLPDYAPGVIATWGEKRAWGTYLDVKTNAPEAYERDHDRIRRGARPAMRIFMSSVTDPYVPQERRYRITRGILERMRERPPDRLVLQTHTPHPLWDLDLLEDLAGRFPLCVQISVETDRESLGPPFPPHACSVESRVDALARLRRRGIETVAVVSPVWPLQDPGRFARRLEASCHRVILDHYLLGDGSKDGSRTRTRLVTAGATFPDLLDRAGWGEWTRLETFDRVARIFREVLGEERVRISKQGFAESAREDAAGATMGHRGEADGRSGRLLRPVPRR